MNDGILEKKLEPAPALIVPPAIAAAAALDAAAPAPGAPAAPGGAAPIVAAPIDYTADARELLDFTIDLLAVPYPSLAAVYPVEVRARLAGHVGDVLKKYGVTWAQLFGRFAPEIGLVVAIAPLAAPTWRAIQSDRAVPAAPGGAAPAAVVVPAKPAAVNLETKFPGLNDSQTSGAAIKS